MGPSRTERRDAYVAKARHDVDALVARGVAIAGNAFSAVLFVKGSPSAADTGTGEPLAGADGKALRAALAALGYAPEDWCAMLTVDERGAQLDAMLIREAVCTLDPSTLVACDDEAAQALRDAYAEQLAQLQDFDEAMLAPGKVARVLGMRVMNLGGFEAALADPHDKQIMWRRLKQIPPLGAPY